MLLPGVLPLVEALGVLLWSLLLRLGKGRILWLGCRLLIRSVLGPGLLVATLGGQARRVRLGLRVLPRCLVLPLLLVLHQRPGGGGMPMMMSLRRTRR